jgi:exonuclease VII large subunit
MRMESLWASVEDLDPFRVMERGYGIILNQEGKAVKSAFALKPAENITILMKDGEASADVISIKEKDHGRRKTNI